jgi:eukaryotic-like serine/threonine-protein kinase
VGAAEEGRLFAGKYRILGELGRGGMGIVFRSEDVRLKRPVALKFLPADVATPGESSERFLREARAAAALDNPHICTVYEAGEAEDRQYIAMALIEGPTLKDRIAQGQIPLTDALTIAREIADGLAEAHSKHVVHRDIKPGNIILAGGRHVKITDFGLARMEGTGQTTQTAGIAGTIAYMSPERVLGHSSDARADIWALGCVVYEMLTGRRPFCSSTGQVDLHALLHEKPRQITECRNDVPKQLVAIVDRCLEKDPGLRYQDAAGVLADLDAAKSHLQGHPSAPDKHMPSIAVLPFVDMSPDKSQAYFGEGIAEELIHAFARIQDLRVVARTSAFALAGKNLDVREIGRMLNVSAVLEGSVRQAGNRLRVTAQLINVENGFHLWSDRFDRDAGDIFAIQDELSMAIVEHLKVSLHVGEKEALQKRPTSDHEAYTLYLKGLYFFARPRPDSLETALRFFRQALALDPGFAKAWVCIGYVYAMFANLNFARPNEAWPEVRAAMEKARLIDDQLPEVHALAATLSFSYEWDWPAAGASFQRVLSINPGNAFSHGEYAWYLMSRRRFDESLREVRLAISLDPLMPIFYAWSVGLHAAAGRYEGAIADFERALEIDPNFGLSYFHAGIAYFRMGQLDKAVEALETGRRIAAHSGWEESMLAVISLAKGDAEGARRIIREMIEDKKRANVSSVALGWALAATGDIDGAMEWLERGIEEHDSLVNFLHIYTDVFAAALAHEPRYQKLLARLNLADTGGPEGG